MTTAGRPVSRPVPAAPPGDELEALVRAGAATGSEVRDDLLDVVAGAPAGESLPSEALSRLRDEERC